MVQHGAWLVTLHGQVHFKKLTRAKQRKIAHAALNVKKSEVYTPYQEVENRQLLFDVMQDSTDLLGHFRRFASSLTTNIVFG